MIRLADLCTEMERSQRHLTPRAARAWWTKGLLPRPQRRGLGRQKGTETFWVESRVIEQAKATHDLLARHSRTYTALIGLWLLGFPIELRLTRSAWLELIAHNQPHRYARYGRSLLDDAVGQLAAKVGPSLLRPDAPAKLKHKATEFCVELLGAFYGVDDEPEPFGLAEGLWATVPYWSNGVSQSIPFNDVQIEWLIKHAHDWFSLPTQSKIVHSASDYEFCRARRVLQVSFGILGRTARRLPIDQRQGFQEQGQIAVVVFGRALLLPLIAILRDSSAAKQISTLLRLAQQAKQGLPAS
ncbi:hypothetical protein [Bradyrhizobium sp. SZCCHNRI1073]|uniref:hypothetical protein n=1 Tax=Bradyrhizobium sp. SZCCHNRI1073 TaxID=3057280 RepID=UPI00291669B7|nr:hypothetical protein [Bradyrhizobium sp. SZCCHNRI1073]